MSTKASRPKESRAAFAIREATMSAEQAAKHFSTPQQIWAAVLGQLLSEEQRLPGQIESLEAKLNSTSSPRQRKTLEFRIRGLQNRLAYLKSDEYSLPHPGVNCGSNMPGGSDIGVRLAAAFT